MSTPFTLPYDLKATDLTELSEVASETIKVVKNFQCTKIKTAGAEARTLADPEKEGQWLILQGYSLTGTCTITASHAYDSAGTTSLVLTTDGHMAVLCSVKYGTSIRWRLVSVDGPALPAQTITTLTATTANITTGNVTDLAIAASGSLKPAQQVASADGAITIKSGVVFITKGSAAALTIANPTATTDDGKELLIISTTAQAHTVSNAAGAGFNNGGAGSDVGTFGGAIGDNIVIVAYQGKWYVRSKTNVTLA